MSGHIAGPQAWGDVEAGLARRFALVPPARVATQRTGWNPRALEVRFQVPVPKSMPKAAVSEAVDKAWTVQAVSQGLQLAAEVTSDDDEEGMFSEDSRKRRNQ